MTALNGSKPALRLVQGAASPAIEWSWFCGHCAAPAPSGQAPAPTARVCRSCGLGLLLETRRDIVPSDRDAFLVIDTALLIQAMSRRAQTLLAVSEEEAHEVLETVINWGRYAELFAYDYDRGVLSLENPT